MPKQCVQVSPVAIRNFPCGENPVSHDEQLVRELILQLKLGRITGEYFRRKFDVDIFETFRPVFDRLEKRRMVRRARGAVELSRAGLLQGDRLLPEFYASQYQNSRYT